MRCIAIAWVGLIGSASACSFIDDFDKYKSAVGDVEDDSGMPDDLDGATPSGNPDASDDGAVGANDGGEVVRDAGASLADAGPDGDGGSTDGGRSDGALPGRCGDGVIDTARGEKCDDGNQKAGDGCEPVTCLPTPPAMCFGISCDDTDVCTVDTCDPLLGCGHRPIDNDADGYSPGTCKSTVRGGDCNDTSAAIHPGAAETCDGVDNNCNGAVDEGFMILRCYPDKDGDGFADYAGTPRMSCGMSCPAGTLSVTDLTDKSLADCWDDPNTGGADVYPGQTSFFTASYGAGAKSDRSFDYDCSGKEVPQFKPLGAADCGGLLGVALCGTSAGFTGNAAPACGLRGEYVTCAGAVLGACSGTSEERTQACN